MTVPLKTFDQVTFVILRYYVFQPILIQYWQNALKGYKYHSDICPAIICPADIGPFEKCVFPIQLNFANNQSFCSAWYSPAPASVFGKYQKWKWKHQQKKL